MKAAIHVALRRPELAPELREWLADAIRASD